MFFSEKKTRLNFSFKLKNKNSKRVLVEELRFSGPECQQFRLPAARVSQRAAHEALGAQRRRRKSLALRVPALPGCEPLMNASPVVRGAPRGANWVIIYKHHLIIMAIH